MTNIIFPFEELPAEMISHVISYMPHQSIVALSLVNRLYNEIITTKRTWRRMHERYFPHIELFKEHTAGDYRRTFFKRYKYVKIFRCAAVYLTYAH